MATHKREPKVEKKDDKIQVVQGNIPLLTVQLLNSINQNLMTLTTYIKNRDMNKK